MARLYPAYARDVLSFLNYAQLELFVSYYPLFTPDTLNALVEEVTHLKVKELYCKGKMNNGVVLDFAMRARPHCKRITIDSEENDTFNAVFQHFQSTVPRIGRDVVQEFCISAFGTYLWPANLAPKEEMEPLSYEQKSQKPIYRLRGGMANINSGENFDVVVLCGRHVEEEERAEYLYDMRLLFK